MQLQERPDWAIIYQVSTANKLKRQNGWCYTTRVHLICFSLKCFLQEVLLTYLKEAKQDIKQERANRTIYFTSKQLQQAQQKQPTN